MLASSRHAALMLSIAMLVPAPALAEETGTQNVVYGMHYGTALLMDVHRPNEPNGHGVIFIGGSGFHAPGHYGAWSLKDEEAGVTPELLKAGYTVFAINHRAAPGFRYPAAVEDAQRAVRFIRHHADGYGIAAEALAAVGGSSGGYLVAMLGVLDGAPLEGDQDPVHRRSAKVQCVVALMAPTDLLSDAWVGAVGASFIASFVGHPPVGPAWREVYRQASPVSHASAGVAAFLLMHGTEDIVVPFEQSERMRDALIRAGVSVEHIPMPGVGHGLPSTWGDIDWRSPLVRWLGDCMARATV